MFPFSLSFNNRRLPIKLTKGQQEEKGDSYCTQGSRNEVAAALHGYSERLICTPNLAEEREGEKGF